MTLEDYHKGTMINLNSDAVTALAPVEKNLCQLFERVKIVGKNNNTVPILLPKQVQQSLHLLKKHRREAGIRETNRYFFAYSHSDNHLRGCDALRAAAEQCGATNPESLRIRSFRKHVATKVRC